MCELSDRSCRKDFKIVFLWNVHTQVNIYHFCSCFHFPKMLIVFLFFSSSFFSYYLIMFMLTVWVLHFISKSLHTIMHELKKQKYQIIEINIVIADGKRHQCFRIFRKCVFVCVCLHFTCVHKFVLRSSRATKASIPMLNNTLKY